MSWQLTNHLSVPPGEYFYDQAIAGGKKRFGPSPLLEHLAKQMSDFRTGNGLARSAFNECLEDAVAFTCTRLGGHRKWCYNTDAAYAAASPIVAKRRSGGCGGCGAHVK